MAIANKNIWFYSIKTLHFLYQMINFVELFYPIQSYVFFIDQLNSYSNVSNSIGWNPIFFQNKILKAVVVDLHMDICHHGFQRESCDLCRMEATNKAPVKIVEDMKQYDLIHPKVQIKDNLSKLALPDLTIRSVEPPEPILPSTLDPGKQIIDKKRDLITKDNMQVGTEIIDPKKKFLMKK